MAAEQDSVWKEVITFFLRQFLAFFFPHIHAVIDWEQPIEFLDTELAKLEPDSEVGKRLADKLVKVFRLDGSQSILLIHIEVQGYYDTHFAERMFIYRYRIFDLFKHPVVSLAVFTDDNNNYRPNVYEENYLGVRLRFEYPFVKLIDYRPDWELLEQDLNPFAIVVMAHLKVLELTKTGDVKALAVWKYNLVVMAYERGYDQQWVRQLYRFLDWLVRLPAALKVSFEARIRQYEEEKQMPFVTGFEQVGIEKGLLQGKLEGKLEGKRDLTLKVLTARVGQLPAEIQTRIAQLSEADLDALTIASLNYSTLTELENWLGQARS